MPEEGRDASAPETAIQSTPLMRQYHAIKQQVPNALLMFRLGDFYELFYEDAVTAARELEITLTARNKEKGQAIPMCGVPYHAADGYLARLIQKGYDKPPYYINLVLGGEKGFQGAMPYTHEVLTFMVKCLPPQSIWCVSGIGQPSLTMTMTSSKWAVWFNAEMTASASSTLCL